VRGTLALDRIARAWALLHGRRYVVPADVDELFLPVLGHRLLLDPYLVETEELPREQALERVKARVLATAPPPDVQVPAAAAAS
jgi:MoxR-like ATPase